MNLIHYNHSMYICLTDALMLAMNSEQFINKVVQTRFTTKAWVLFTSSSECNGSEERTMCEPWLGRLSLLLVQYSNEHSVMSILTHKMSEGWQTFHQVMSVSGLCQTGVASQRIASPAGGKQKKTSSNKLTLHFLFTTTGMDNETWFLHIPKQRKLLTLPHVQKTVYHNDL